MIEAEVAERFAPGEFSAFAADAIARSLQRLRVEEWLAEREASRGGKPLPPAAIKYADEAWRKQRH